MNRQRKSGWGSSRFVWTGAICGAVFLIAVGCLQYRWNMQIRRATEVRLGADLESVMMKWHLNLYREFSTICIALQVGPDSGAEDHWNDYLRRYEQWRSVESSTGSLENLYSNPDVVSNIYIYETSRGSDERLLMLNPDADRIEPSGKPTELQDLLRRLQARSANLPTALRAWEPDDPSKADVLDRASSVLHSPRSKTITGWQFDETIPAIVHPILHRTNHVVTADAPVDWLVVILNRDTITRRIFPELAHRYFEDAHGLQYKVAVASAGKTSHLLYSSEPDFGVTDLSAADSVMNIFGPPPESTEASFWQVANDRESLHGDEWHRFSGPVWFPVFQNADTNHWVLFLKPLTGSIEAPITKIWQANLLSGVVVLLLLAGSVLLVMVSTYRERTLAAMQVDFVTSISHELRTPLAGVLAAAQNIRDGYAGDLPHYGNLIAAQIRQLIDLVDQILLFAALKDNKKKYQLTGVPIDEVVDSLQKTTFAVLSATGFNIELRIDEKLPDILGDKQALLRCLQNLIQNAAKYGGTSKWIGVAFQLEERSDLRIRISVSDHGVGIEPAELERIFEPFYRGAHATQAQIHGSGLGLSVVQQIVHELQGSVSVSSKLGVGTDFVLHLRAVKSPPLQNINERQETLACQ